MSTTEPTPTKIEEAEFQLVCMYCGKLNLLEHHRRAFFGLKECLDSNIKDLKIASSEGEKLKTKIAKLEANISTLRDANTSLVVEYEQKLEAERDVSKNLTVKLASQSGFDKLTQDHAQLTQRFDSLSGKMEEMVRQNTELAKQKREMNDHIIELEATVAKQPSKEEEPLNSTVDTETFRAKLRAELEKEQKAKLEEIRSDFVKKCDEFKKSSFALKVEPLDKKKV